jgi:mRNA interferase MazF
MPNPKRGEIWLVDLSPAVGQEIQKTRPVIVISSDLFSPIAIRITIPITSWQEKFNNRPFMVRIGATQESGLDRDSAGNLLQIRSLSTERFIRKLGQALDETLQELVSGLAICVDYEQAP